MLLEVNTITQKFQSLKNRNKVQRSKWNWVHNCTSHLFYYKTSKKFYYYYYYYYACTLEVVWVIIRLSNLFSLVSLYSIIFLSLQNSKTKAS